MKLEVAVVPVADVDRAKHSCQALGWREDADFAAAADSRVVQLALPGSAADSRVVQLAPPGSACSMIVGTGITSAAPGSAQGLHLAVGDIEAARAGLASRGADASGVFHDASGVFHDASGVFHRAGTQGRVPGPAPDHKSYGSFVSFSDPDGNGWCVQEITNRPPGR